VVSKNDPFVMYEGKKVYVFSELAARRWSQTPSKSLNTEIRLQLRDVLSAH